MHLPKSANNFWPVDNPVSRRIVSIMSDRMPGQRFQGQPAAAPDRPVDSWQAPDAPTPGVTVQRYRSHAGLIGVIVGIVVVAVVAVAVWAGTRPANNSAPGATPTSGAPLPSCPTPSPGWQAIPYEASTGTGCWAVSEGQWNGTTVTINVTLTSDQGPLSVTFFALDNSQSSNQYDPSGGSMVTARVPSGQSSTGTLEFDIPQGDFTLYMLKYPPSIKDMPIAALVIKG